MGKKKSHGLEMGKKKSHGKSNPIYKVVKGNNDTLKTKSKKPKAVKSLKMVESMGYLLTTEERVEVIFLYSKPGSTCRSTADEFNRRHPDRQPIAHGTVGKLVRRFKETGSVCDRPKSGRPKSATDADTSQTVIELLLKSPEMSLRKLSNETGVSASSVSRILKGNNFHPYKVQLVQELHGDNKCSESLPVTSNEVS